MPRPAAGARLRFMESILHLELRLRPAADPIAGWLTTDGGPDVAFTGYLEFLAVLECLLRTDAEVRAAS